MLTPSEINPRYALTPIHVLKLVGVGWRRGERVDLAGTDELTTRSPSSELANEHVRIQTHGV